MERTEKQQKKRTEHKTFKNGKNGNQRREEKNKIKNIIYMSPGAFSRRREGKNQQN